MVLRRNRQLQHRARQPCLASRRALLESGLENSCQQHGLAGSERYRLFQANRGQRSQHHSDTRWGNTDPLYHPPRRQPHNLALSDPALAAVAVNSHLQRPIIASPTTSCVLFDSRNQVPPVTSPVLACTKTVKTLPASSMRI